MKTLLLGLVVVGLSLSLTGCQFLGQPPPPAGSLLQTVQQNGGFEQGMNLGGATNTGINNLGDTLRQVQQATKGELVPSLNQGRDSFTGNPFDPVTGRQLDPKVGTNTAVGTLVNQSNIQAMGRKVDAYIAGFPGSKLKGHGTFIAACAAKYRVPLDLALAMWKMEASMCAKGVAPRANNPGNMKDLKGRWGRVVGNVSGHAKYDSILTGIEAYFRMMSDPTWKYWRHVQSGNIAAIIKDYAPASDGNNEGAYVASVNADRARIRDALA